MTEEQPKLEDLLTSVEAAERLGIDRGTLTRWVQAGRISRAMKLPGKQGPALFDPAEVERARTESQEQAAS
ncbi:MAG TPA: helix-turn-helix domain-containing protein [Nitrospirales bacterium]